MSNPIDRFKTAVLRDHAMDINTTDRNIVSVRTRMDLLCQLHTAKSGMLTLQVRQRTDTNSPFDGKFRKTPDALMSNPWHAW